MGKNTWGKKMVEADKSGDLMYVSFFVLNVRCIFQGTNISLTIGNFEDEFPFPVWWDMLVPWRVFFFGKQIDGLCIILVFVQ